MASNLFFDKNLKGTTPFLIKIDHPDMESPFYWTDNNEPLEYDGQTYEPYYFKITMPQQSTDSMGSAKLTIGCVDQQLIRLIRTLTTAPIVTFIAEYLEDGIYSPLDGYEMNLSNISWDATTMTGDLTLDILLNYEFPSGEFNPFNTQGVA